MKNDDPVHDSPFDRLRTGPSTGLRTSRYLLYVNGCYELSAMSHELIPAYSLLHNPYS
jgi:hypothetical protein